MIYSVDRKPRVSIIMPVLNGERYINESIESILGQTYQDFELIVVDDGSTDRTPELIRAFSHRTNLKYVRHAERQGIARSVNDGVRNSSGELIAFLDHDDTWFPNFLETQVGHLDQHPEVAMVHSDFQTIDADGNVLQPSVAALRDQDARPSGYVFPRLFMDSFIVGDSAVIRKECWEKLGGFDESIRFGDYLLWMRIARHHRIDYVPKVLTQYRLHAVQSTQAALVTDPDQASVGVQAIKKILELYPEARGELGARTIGRRFARLYSDLAYRWFSEGEFPTARRCLRKSIRNSPTNIRYYVIYGATFLPKSALTAARKAWRRIRGRGPADQRTTEQPHPVADGRSS
jgi:glycosyltransferase involved in cell wall biosynthesis